MINGHQGKMLNMLYMYILIYWWNRLIFRAAINWYSNHSRKTTLFISWWWSPSFDLARNTKSQPSRRVLYDQVFNINYRCNYLRKIKSLRETGYDIMYMDETWVNQNHCTDYMWLPNDESDAPKIPSGKGKRLIVLHACTRSEDWRLRLHL
jgi:hypothetical protein